MTDVYDTLDHFSRAEFGDYADEMSPRLLRCLDAFRALWGSPVRISPAYGALGRHDGPDGTSQHNVDRWGEVRAADVFAYGLDTDADAQRAIDCAQQAGLTGIGLYPDWSPSPGLHLDVREGDRIATWGALDDGVGGQRYYALSAAIQAMRA